MCQIIIKPKGKLLSIDNLDIAQSKNKDGQGVMWYNEDESKMYWFKTLDYDVFKDIIINQVKHHVAVVHLRWASKGGITTENLHPFKTSHGAMLCHNGTLSSWGNDTISDTQELAETFRKLNIDWEAPATKTLISHIIGTAYNKIVVMKPNGHVIIFNENLFIEEDGILYSNTGHHKPVAYTPPVANSPVYSRSYYTERFKDNVKRYADYDDDYDIEKYLPSVSDKVKVFVYGSLKSGKMNNGLLGSATFLGKATAIARWAMVDNLGGSTYPYVLGKHYNGEFIVGEVYEVDSDTKEVLDILEGVPSHYLEDEIYVQYADGRTDKAVIYTLASTTTKPSLVYGYDKNKFIEEW